MSNADRIFDMLKPDEIYKKIKKPYLELRNSYRIPKVSINNYDEFKKETAKFYQYMLSSGKVPLRDSDINFVFGQAKGILSGRYQNSYNAFEMQKAGLENGMEGIYDRIYDHFLKQSEKRYIVEISNIFLEYDDATIKDFFEKYFRLYGNRLDKHYGYYLSNIQKFISAHIEMERKK